MKRTTIYDHELVKKLLEEAPPGDNTMWVALSYEQITGRRIERKKVNELRRGFGLPSPYGHGYQIRRDVMREILMEDPWLVAHVSMAARKYWAITQARHPNESSIRRWMRIYGVKLAMESPHWDSSVVSAIRERNLRGYMIPAEAADGLGCAHAGCPECQQTDAGERYETEGEA